MIEAPNPTSGGHRWPVYASYVVVLGMVSCFAIVAIQFLQWLFPTWDARGMLIVCILAALEAFASFWMVKRLSTAQRQIVFYRLTEWVIILVILKFFTEMLAGPTGFWNNLLLWPVNFPANILNTHYLLTILPVFVIWQISNLFAADLALLGVAEAGLLDERTRLTPIRDLILRRFLNLGMFVVLLAGIPPQVVIPTPRLVASNTAVPAVVLYFALGIALLSLTRYTSMVTNWRQARVSIPVQIPRRWFTYSAVILGILVMLVAWLPTNYGMGFFETFTTILDILYQALVTIYAFIILFINYIARLIFRPTGIPQGPVQPLIPPSLPQNKLPLNNTLAINWILIKSIFFWVVLIVLVVVALRQYISFNQDLAEELKRFKPLNWWFVFWKRFTASFKKANKSVGIFVQSSLRRLRSIGRSPARSSEWDFINPRRLNPRQKIIFYYLALVRRADEAGLPRKDGQTPYEYAHSLTSSLEEGKDGVEALTESFVEARYSRHDIPAKEARRIESIWETIRRVLRIVRKSRQEEKHSKGN